MGRQWIKVILTLLLAGSNTVFSHAESIRNIPLNLKVSEETEVFTEEETGESGPSEDLHHVHNEDCYAKEGELLCTLSEDAEHTHTEDCYANGGEMLCGMGEDYEPMLLEEGANIVDSFDALKTAIASGETEIILAGNIEFNETLVIQSGKNIVFKTNEGNPVICSSTALNSKPMILVEEGADFVLDGDVTLDGTNALYYVNCLGNFTMNNGTLTSCKINTSTSRIGGVTVSGENAVFTMNGGEIKNTTSNYSHKGAVYVYDNAKFVMNAGMIRNNEFGNQFCAAVVIDGSDFEMNNGEISENIIEAGQLSSAGGVLVMGLGFGQVTTSTNAKSASFVMNDGKISGNESHRGGGVYVLGGSAIYTDFYSKAYFTMNGGEISENRTRNFNVGGSSLTSGGAGIYVEWAGEVTMNGGTIRNNSTEGMGGGVATNDAFTNYFGTNPYESAGNRQYNGLYYRNWPSIFPASFTMNGGKIIENTALTTSLVGDQGCGGGVYIASNNVVLNAGDISNNRAGKQGGGVYVGSVPYVLNIKDALITENSASVIGGGIWLCPTGEAAASVNNGAALYNNHADGAADDFAAVHTFSDYEATLSGHMLGGGLANWYQDGGVDTSSLLGTADTSIARYDSTGNDNVKIEDTSLLKGGVSLKSVPSSEAQAAAKTVAKLTITGNSSTRGGGIGSNGNVVIGDEFDLTRDLTINKQWLNSTDLPEQVTVWIVIDGQRTQSVELKKESGWTAEVKDLPIIGELSVEEETPAGWKVSYRYEMQRDGNVNAIVTNTKIEPVSVVLGAKKTIDGKTPTASAFRFSLLDENGRILQTVSNHGEKVEFTALTFDTDGTYHYRVREEKGNDRKIVYDESIYDVTIVISNHTEAQITIQKNNETKDVVLFENKTVDIPKKPPVPNTGDQ